MQAYIQSTSNFNPKFYIQLLLKLISVLGASFDHVIKDMKPLYGILKAGNYWFATYHIHYKEKLGIKESIYNLCHFYKTGLFGII